MDIDVCDGTLVKKINRHHVLFETTQTETAHFSFCFCTCVYDSAASSPLLMTHNATLILYPVQLHSQ